MGDVERNLGGSLSLKLRCALSLVNYSEQEDIYRKGCDSSSPNLKIHAFVQTKIFRRIKAKRLH